MKYNFAPEVKKLLKMELLVLFSFLHNIGIWKILLVCIIVPFGSASCTYIWDILRWQGKIRVYLQSSKAGRGSRDKTASSSASPT